MYVHKNMTLRDNIANEKEFVAQTSKCVCVRDLQCDRLEVKLVRLWAKLT
jgi:hypothetical protein